MKNHNTSKIDSKGRLLIPTSIRNLLKINEGCDMILNLEKDQLKIFPVIKEKTAKLRLILSDSVGSLANAAEILAKDNINILMSESKSNRNNAEWEIIVDTSKCDRELKKIKENLVKSNLIKKVELINGI